MSDGKASFGPKMAYILRVYMLTDDENREEIEHDQFMLRVGAMSKREYEKRRCTRDVARTIRRRDDGGLWPRDDPKFDRYL
jgi:hypothetical protein